MLVHKKTHELRNSDRRMSIIHLEGCLIRQILQSAVLSQVLCESLLERGRDEEILLLQAKFLARIVVVVRVEDFGDCICKILLLDSLVIVAFIK